MEYEYIDKGYLYYRIKREAETHDLPAVKEAYERVTEIIDQEFSINGEIMKWNPFNKRPLTEDEKKVFPEYDYMIEPPEPEDDEEVLVSDGHSIWITVYHENGSYFEEQGETKPVKAWMRLPKPYKGE